MNKSIKIISENALVAALYVVLTLISSPLSFGLIQFRIAEFLMILCFFRKDFVIGVTLGCLISNISLSTSVLGSLGWIDLIFGTLATLLSGLIMPYCKRLLFSCLVPVILNGLIVGFELFYFMELNNFWVCFGFVALGEFVVIILFGYILTLILKNKYKKFYNLIGANINLEVKW